MAITPVVPTPDYGIYLNTYIKFGSAPNNANDYDFYAETGTGYIYDKDNNILTSPSFSNQTVVYVWSNNASQEGYIQIIGTETIEHTGGTTYDTAVAITLTENCEIRLCYGETQSGGGSI